MSEGTQHRAGHRLPVLLLDPAHLHAQVPRFDDHAHSFRADLFRNGFGDLAGHAFLDLQASCIHVDQPRNLAEPQHSLAGQIGDVSLAEGAASNDGVAWSQAREGGYMCTPLVYRGLVYIVKFNGIISAFDARTGERKFQQRLAGGTAGPGFCTPDEKRHWLTHSEKSPPANEYVQRK